MANSRICSIDGCGKPHEGRGWCKKHYERWRKTGDPHKKLKRVGHAERFLLEVVRNYDGNECLIWPFYRDERGYGKVKFQGRIQSASRAACIFRNGPPPSEFHQAAHNCGNGNGGCVAPAHMRWATMAENNKDKIEHGTSTRGVRNPKARLTEEEVRAIRILQGLVGRNTVAKRYGVAKGTIQAIWERRNWSWLV